jgi:hypothetical protein
MGDDDDDIDYKNINKNNNNNKATVPVREFHERSIIPDRTTHNNGPKVAILDKTIKAAHSIVTAIPNSHNLHSTITEKLQKYTDLTEKLEGCGN